MPTRLGDTSYPGGVIPRHFTGTISRSTTSNAHLFTLPQGTTILSMRVLGSLVSNGTMGRISVGCNSSERIFISEYNVTTNGNLQASPSSSLLIGSALPNLNATDVIGRYDEVGSASTAGGPWTVDFEVI